MFHDCASTSAPVSGSVAHDYGYYDAYFRYSTCRYCFIVVYLLLVTQTLGRPLTELADCMCCRLTLSYTCSHRMLGGGPRVVVSTAAFHAGVRGSVPGLGGLKETKMFLPHPHVKLIIVGSLRVREVACSASDRQGSNFESCVLRTVSSQSSHHPQEVLLAQFSLYVHKGGLKPDSFHFLISHSMLSYDVIDFYLSTLP